MTNDALHYDEFSMFEENCDDAGLPWKGQPVVRRQSFTLASGQKLSALVWGSTPPELVFLHGGGQNAHTWDTVVLGLDRSAIAFDLPGHGHSDWRADRDYWPLSNAAAVAEALDQMGVKPRAVIGMSLGGLTTIHLAATRPDLVPQAVIVDVTPGVHQRAIAMTLEERGTTALIGGPKIYDTFDEIYEATLALSPYRKPSGVRRGVLHNTRRLEDGRWRWRYDIGGGDDQASQVAAPPDFLALWDDVDRLSMPVMLVEGGAVEARATRTRRRVPPAQARHASRGGRRRRARGAKRPAERPDRPATELLGLTES